MRIVLGENVSLLLLVIETIGRDAVDGVVCCTTAIFAPERKPGGHVERHS